MWLDHVVEPSASDGVQGGQTQEITEGVTAFLNCDLASCKGADNDSTTCDCTTQLFPTHAEDSFTCGILVRFNSDRASATKSDAEERTLSFTQGPQRS
jgi:hypothetical protein